MEKQSIAKQILKIATGILNNEIFGNFSENIGRGEVGSGGKKQGCQTEEYPPCPNPWIPNTLEYGCKARNSNQWRRHKT